MNRRQKLVQKQFLNNEKTVIKRLEYIYDGALSDINKKIRELEFHIGDLTEVYDWLEDDDPQKEVIRSKIQSKIYQKQYQEQLQKQVDGILKEMQTKQFLTVSDYLDTCYEDGFIGSVFDLHGQGVPLMMPLDQTKMVRAVQLDSKISKGLYSRLGEDVGLLKKKITAQVSRSIATGTSYAQCAQQLAGYTRIGYNNAIRIARTEGHRIQTTAAMDTMEGAKERGADVVKQWDSTLDGRTRESHVAMDGQIREVDEKFSNGLMYPGDPAGGAGEVINCRCALLQRARWALGDGFSKWDNFAGKLEEFDRPEDYDEFKKSFFSDENRKYMNFVQQMEQKYDTRDFRTVLELMTEHEYDHYSDLLKNNPVYNKKAPEPAVDDRFGIKLIQGKHSMTDDLPLCNPNYSTGMLYQNNCGYCSVTYDMRRRGYDVEAMPKNGLYTYEWQALWKGFRPHGVNAKRKNTALAEMTKEIQSWGDGARGSVFVVWDGRSWGHFFSVEVIDGEVVFIDPQNGKSGEAVADYFKRVKPSSIKYGRVDNLELSDKITEAVKTRGD